MKKILKRIFPPIIFDLYRLFNKHKYGWFGEFSSWKDFDQYSIGYDNNEILNKVRNSSLQVKKGAAKYERDGCLFEEINYSWPLLAGLMYAAAKSGGALKVLDFGGSLGSTYYQNKIFIESFETVSWSIVEQQKFVDLGLRDFQSNYLKFYHSVDEAIKINNTNILLLLSVIQYLEVPYKKLDSLLKNNFKYILIDRTPFIKKKEMLKLQKVNPSIYKASYPCWFFDEIKFINFFKNKNYSVKETFLSEEGENNEYVFKGFILEKNE